MTFPMLLQFPASLLLKERMIHFAGGVALVLCINTLRPRQKGRHFPDDIFKCIFFNENIWISIKFSLKFVPKGPINNIPALVQIMAWHRSGNKLLSEPMLVSLLTHICVTRPQWVNVMLQVLKFGVYYGIHLCMILANRTGVAMCLEIKTRVV